MTFARQPLSIDALPGYWLGRLRTRELLSDHSDHEAEDAKVAEQYRAIIAGLGAKIAPEDIPEWREIAQRHSGFASS